jgi:hypothetical protein
MSSVQRLASAVLVVLLAVAVGVPSEHGDGVAAIASPVADQTFTDTSNDSTGRIDIRTVRVTSSGDSLDIRVNLAQKTIGATEHIAVTLDFNLDHRRDLSFYFRGDGGGTLRHVRYPSPATFEVTPATMGTFSNNDFGITFNLRLSGIGNPARFDFYAFAKEFDEPEVWDFAPDGDAWWSFVVQEPPPPGGGGGGGGGGATPDFVARGSAMSPSPPRAGDSVGVGTRFAYRGSGETVTTGRLRCSGTIGARSIRGRAVRDDRLHACFFALPRTSGGQLFTGRVTLALGGRERSVQRSGRIVAASALRIEGPKTFSDPAAGKPFPASFKVTLVRGGSAKPVTSGEVDCRATAGGRPVRFPSAGWDPDEKGNTYAICNWPIPPSARGKIFQGTITVRSGGLTGTKTFSRRVR